MTKRILVIEDQPDNRRILRDLLGSVGYDLTEAENGTLGVESALAEPPDLILMDIQIFLGVTDSSQSAKTAREPTQVNL